MSQPGHAAHAQSALTIHGSRERLEALAAAFEHRHGEHGLPLSLHEREPDRAEGSAWSLSLYVATVEADDWLDLLVLLAREQGLGDDVEREDFAPVDWVAQTLRELSPVRAGRFLVHGSHDRAAVRVNDCAVEVDAGLAFGTGHHGTTAGCLRMLDRALRRGRPRRVVDVGTGSGVLAIAAAKAARVPVLATDIDPVAVAVARANARSNGVGVFVHTQAAAGFEAPAFGTFGRADILLANILAGPLRRLARPMRPHLSAGATVILSGLLSHQAPGVAAHYRLQGLALERAHRENGWMTLVLRAPHAS